MTATCVLLERVDERRVVHQLHAFEAREDDGQIGARVALKEERRPVGDVQVDAALQADGAGQEPAGGDDDAPAARRGARPDRVADRAVASVDPSPRAPNFVMSKSRAGNTGRGDAREDGVALGPARGLRLAGSRDEAARGEREADAAAGQGGEKGPPGIKPVRPFRHKWTTQSGNRRECAA